jgi:hypothetical protein
MHCAPGIITHSQELQTGGLTPRRRYSKLETYAYAHVLHNTTHANVLNVVMPFGSRFCEKFFNIQITNLLTTYKGLADPNSSFLQTCVYYTLVQSYTNKLIPNVGMYRSLIINKN